MKAYPFKKLLFGLLVGLLCTQTAKAQVKFYADFTTDFSSIPETLSVLEPTTQPYTGFQSIDYQATIKESFNVRPGFTVNFGIAAPLTEKFQARIGIGSTFRNYKRNVAVEYPNTLYHYPIENGIYGSPYLGPLDQGDQSFVFNPTPRVGETRLLYVTIPVQIQYSLLSDRLAIGLGITNYLLAYSSQVAYQLKYQYSPSDYSEGSMDLLMEEYTDKSGTGLGNYLISSDLFVRYKLIKQMGITLSYQHGLSDIYHSTTDFESEAKYRSISFGLSYYFN